MKIGMIGSGQFAPSFAKLWQLHPGVAEVWACDVLPERSSEIVERLGLAGQTDSFEDMIARDDIDAVAIITQRWTHHDLVTRALKAGKNVYSAVPMALEVNEMKEICDLVTQTGLVYMMGETSYYNPAVIHAREQIASGAWGRVFYAEGDYVHDMDNGFYAAYQYSGGENWKQTASYPPMLYPTHTLGGVLGAWPTHAVSVSCIGVVDNRDDGVFDRDVSLWGNEFSNMSALIETADGGVVRANEFRRVGHPGRVHESRFRFYGTDGVMEQTSTGASFSTRDDITDISDLFHTKSGQLDASIEVEGLDPALLHSFQSGLSKVHPTGRLPKEFDGAPNGHEGSHHYLADDFVRAVSEGKQPPVNAWVAARFNLPGVVAMQSAKQGGERLAVPDFGDCPLPVIEI